MACKLEKLGVAPVIVPSDGNCMVWSCLVMMDASHSVFDRNYTSDQSQAEQVELRSSLKQLWLDHQNDPTWQVLFHCMNPEIAEMATPPKKAKNNKKELDITPPRPDDPNPKRARVGECRPVPSLAPPEKEPVELRPPCSKAAPTFLEPEIPDLAEAIEEKFDKDQKAMDLRDYLAEDEGPNPNFAKSSHARSCRSRQMSKHEKQLDNLTTWFAHKGVTYQRWLSAHRDKRTLKKAWACDHQGWKKVLERLAAGNELTCQVCKSVFDRADVNLDKIEDVLCDDGGGPEEAAGNTKEQEFLGTEHLIAPKVRIGNDLAQCLKLIDKLGPVNQIFREGENNTRLLFRCRLCVTKQQPKGKVNVLGPPIYEKILHFLGQHIRSRTHQQKLSFVLGLDEKKRAPGEPEFENTEPEQVKVKKTCQGYCVTAPDSGGTLCHYPEEFRLWLTHNNFASKFTKHEYTTNFTAGHWYVRHHECLEDDIQPGMSCCWKCKTLGDPKKVQRNMLRFIIKYHAAHLLSKRLFCADEEARLYDEMVLESNYGKRHPQQWKKVVDLNPAELQNYVRSSWMCLAPQDMTSNIQLFISSVVQPTLRVNATSIDSQMKSLFSGFVKALAKQNMTVSWYFMELDQVNLKIMEAACFGRLDESPLVQGILAQTIIFLEKQGRGVGISGRPPQMTETEAQLISDAALTLSVAGNNKVLAAKLGQSLGKAKIHLDDLEKFSLPNPALALLSSSQMSLNLQLIDQKFPRSSAASPKRLMLGIDHTYLIRSLVQATIGNIHGLVGAPWSPGNEADAFMALGNLPDGATKKEKASMMLSCVLWNPSSVHREVFPLASMPMSLARTKVPDETQAPLTHRSMDVTDRCQNAMTAFCMLDLFRLVADKEAFKRGVPRGSLFLSHQTLRNLQCVALSGIIVAASPDRQGDAWRYGHHRLSELPVEEHFGVLRMQSASAQLTTRGFWVAEAREMLRQRSCSKNGSKPVEHTATMLSAADFYECSCRALRSALRLVGHCANVESLETLYREWCESGQFSANLEPFEPYDPDELQGEDGETHHTPQEDGAAEHRNLLNQIRDETIMMNEDVPDQEGDLLAFELRHVPDAETLREAMSSRPDPLVAETPDAAKKTNNPKTLHAALCFLSPSAPDTEVFDQLWRLTMYLRYNEHKLKEARMEEETDLYRQRTGRLDKWREAARAATGQVVLAMIPKKHATCSTRNLLVCYVTSIWISPRKPKLATSKVSMNYVAAVRVLEMTFQKTSKLWAADSASIAWVLEPTAVAAILDVDHVLENENSLRVVLSSACNELLDKGEELEKTWPSSETGEGGKKKASGLYVTRPRKARKKTVRKKKNEKGQKGNSKKGKGEKEKAGEENEEASEENEEAGEENEKSDTEKPEEKSDGEKPAPSKFSKLKKAKKPTELPEFAASNILKTGTGMKLIEEYMSKLKAKDEEAFPASHLFCQGTDICKLNLPKVKQHVLSINARQLRELDRNIGEAIPENYKAALRGTLGSTGISSNGAGRGYPAAHEAASQRPGNANGEPAPAGLLSASDVEQEMRQCGVGALMEAGAISESRSVQMVAAAKQSAAAFVKAERLANGTNGRQLERSSRAQSPGGAYRQPTRASTPTPTGFPGPASDNLRVAGPERVVTASSFRLTRCIFLLLVKREEIGNDSWRGHCPCCKRPLTLELAEPWAAFQPLPAAKGRFAYVINLWGSSSEYVLGALVLGHSIRRSGSSHARVCLCAEDVPEAFVQLLAEIWERKNIDELFELQAPAAMRRGAAGWLKTGDAIDGRAFFMGHDDSRWSWGQGTGINAGVMLLQPNQHVFNEMVAELSEPNHPEHCNGNGPEQDYLSRYWADSPWKHIGVEYNFQIHHFFNCLHPDKVDSSKRVALAQADKVKVVHFSGEDGAKPWRRILDEQLKLWPDRSKDAEFLDIFMEQFQGYWLWMKRDKEWLEDAGKSDRAWEVSDLFIDGGNLYRRGAEGAASCVNLPEEVSSAVRGFLQKVLDEAWQQVSRASLQPRPDGRGKSSELFRWKRQGEWWIEELPAQCFKATVVCQAGPSKSVSFLEDDVTTLEVFGQHATGLWIKAIGGSFCTLVAGGQALALEEWLEAQRGANFLLAMVGSVAESPLPEATALLQLPSPPEKCGAFAAAGTIGSWHGLHAASHAFASADRQPTAARAVPWFLCTLCSWFVCADLDVELYRTAKKSPDLTAVEGDVQKISETRMENGLEFLQEQRPTRHVALLLHDANCPHCRKALPELDLVAKALLKEPVVLGHVDCTSNKAAMRTHFNLKGFPCLLFWRKQPESLDELVGKTVVVDSDSAFLLRASRLAGLGAERDKSRLALLGKEVVILQVDGKDMTVQVETETKQKVWIPHEVLMEQGRRVPYRREEAMTKYQNLWEKDQIFGLFTLGHLIGQRYPPDLMQNFVQRAMQPLVAKLPSSSLESLEKEDGHALVLCAAALSRGFLEAATNYHQTLRAFHTPSCPELGPGDHILSYSPASLQWTAVRGRAKAAVAVAGKEVTSNDTHLGQWVEQHQYPGISALTIHSVHAWLRAGRPTVLLAIKLNDLEKNIMVETQLREVGKPTPVGNMELYSYGPFDRYLGVADGTLEGFNYFGVAASNLPRVVVFDDPEHWVEDEDYVTAERQHRGGRGALVLVWLVTWAVAHVGTYGDVGYVQGATWGRPSPTRILMQVKERSPGRRAPSRGGRPRGKDAEATKLTTRIRGDFERSCGWAYLQLLPCCAYHRLATWKRSGTLAKAADSLKLPKLNARVQKMIEKGASRNWWGNRKK
eukprot:s210_g14.t1